jgi:1-acyl-sn-glycerol-3-phosphate acyltransferase
MVTGEKHIPNAGPGLVVFNHFSREDFSILFPVVGLAASIPAEMHWIMTGAWTFPGNPLRRPLRAVSKWVFKRIARVYGFTLTPPMPPESADALTRTEAVRRVFQHIKANPSNLVALAPEGRDFPGGVLGELPPGAGKFTLELNRRLGSIHPVGIYEEDGSLRINFGPPFDLGSIINSGSNSLDEKAGWIVMEHIAALLPDRMAGPYKT